MFKVTKDGNRGKRGKNSQILRNGAKQCFDKETK